MSYVPELNTFNYVLELKFPVVRLKTSDGEKLSWFAGFGDGE
jgi:hypothetical protein